MNIENFISIGRNVTGEERREEVRRENTATDFEELFARHLVREMTRGTFSMADEASGIGQANSLYREFITDALSGELAAQRKLGMADMVLKYWDRKPDQQEAERQYQNAITGKEKAGELPPVQKTGTSQID